MTSRPVLLVFSHLRWGFVYQRPQHLLSRLARRWQVLFVEEPVLCEGPAWLDAQTRENGITLLVPHTPVSVPGFHDDQVAVLQSLVAGWLQKQRLEVDVTWLYTPMALPLVQAAAPGCLVYDCMDELSAFKDAPRQLRQRESALLKNAALVLTGGPSLYEAKRDRNDNVVCLPSAVDAAHYAPAGLVAGSYHALAAEQLQGALPGPRLGYFGVVDERLDLTLVTAAADAHPEWSLVMAGPVVKIAPDSLPQRANIHWLGMQPYARLPHLLAGWDVSLMPFALNEHTRFISPTKTLEYMAGEKPVVSTAVRDVISLYGEGVVVADVVNNGAQAFVQACEQLLAESATERTSRASTMSRLVSQYSWGRSAERVHSLLMHALERASASMESEQADPLTLDAAALRQTAPRAPASVPASARAAAAGGARA
ncbi:MAG: glycosyltransferase [Rubrivivax sp.]|nr:glycosyltransferase [Rubrivivax sp.]